MSGAELSTAWGFVCLSVCFPTSRCHTPASTKVLPPRLFPLPGALRGLGVPWLQTCQHPSGDVGERQKQRDRGYRLGAPHSVSPLPRFWLFKKLLDQTEWIGGVAHSELLRDRNWGSRCTISISNILNGSSFSFFRFPKKVCHHLESHMGWFCSFICSK